jgi:hypothetical protein
MPRLSLRFAVIGAGIVLAGCGGSGGSGNTSQLLLVPKLEGHRSGNARQELASRGLEARFTTIRNACAGAPPVGRIVAQLPRSGQHVRRGSDVFLQASCGARATIRRCSARDLAVGAHGFEGEFLGGGVMVVRVEIRNHQTRPCEARSTLHLALLRPDGALGSPIRGNPARLGVTRMLGPGQTLRADWAWLGWCGEKQPFVVSAEFAGAQARGHTPTPGHCRPIPSVLGRTDGPLAYVVNPQAYETARSESH